MDKLQEIKSQADKATEGPWTVGGMDSGHSRYEMNWWVSAGEVNDSICDMDGLHRSSNEQLAKDDGWHDADFIASSRTNVPLMADALISVLDLHVEDVFLGMSNGCIFCGPEPEGPEYPCKTVKKIHETLSGM